MRHIQRLFEWRCGGGFVGGHEILDQRPPAGIGQRRCPVLVYRLRMGENIWTIIGSDNSVVAGRFDNRTEWFFRQPNIEIGLHTKIPSDNTENMRL